MLLSFFFKLEALIVGVLVIHMIGVVFASSIADLDRLALRDFKAKITQDPEAALTSWNDSLPLCRWRGVTCGRRHKRVTMLNLYDIGLVGSLSPHLGNMSFLRYINFMSNQLHGSIPLEIGHLHRLQVLSLYNNSFTGEIPANMSSWPKLSLLDLGHNKLSGKIPNTFSSLLKITSLSFAENNLTGGIPPSLGNLTSLELLNLCCSQLEGSIPNSFYRLTNLQTIELGENYLVGAFPSFIFNLSMLGVLSIPENQFEGRLPSNLCMSQPYFTVITLGTNQFSGFIPHSISNCSQLEILDVDTNQFKGEITIDFGRLQHLKFLFFSYNNFGSKNLDDMKFFHSLSNCSNLDMMDLGHNQLGGVIPNSLGNFSSKLSFLRMYSNYISGNIPSSIGNLLGLSTLTLAENNLVGIIPESIGKLQNLQSIYLSFNNLSGVIPISIGNLSLVSKVLLHVNNLEGNIPLTIGSCKNLIVLGLFDNNLSGSLPKELLQLSSLSIALDLSKNNMSGVIPQEIGNMKLIEILDFSMNHFTGELPRSLGSCISLQYLNLSDNFFYGSIPESYSSLKGLESVGLSRNNFSGHIPTYLQEIHLAQLDVSYNNFEGEVPAKGVFANTSAVSVIGNTRLCGGAPKLHLPKCTGTTSNTKGHSRKLSIWVVIALLLCSIVAGLAAFLLVFFYCRTKKKIDKPLELGLAESFEKISYGRLFKATEGFSSENLIGMGSYASVYKGIFDENGFTGAIKVLNLQHRRGFKSFMAECEALRNIRHRNLVKVITACSSVDHHGNDFKALVYEFMPNGSLESWLHSLHHKLDLFQRINIIKDVACALDYLHCHCGIVIVHCDLKPSNILLDDDMVAYVGDFGLAKILFHEEGSNANECSSSIIRGTVGYAPPEYGLGNEVATSGDIYSFGILLLEMLIGKTPVDPMFEGGLSLHSYAKSALAGGFVLQIIDPVLLTVDVNEKSLVSLVKIGVQCSYESPHDRMDIEGVVHELFAT